MTYKIIPVYDTFYHVYFPNTYRYIICLRTKMNHFFCTSETVSLPGTGRSARSRLRGMQGGCVYTRQKFWPRPGSVARAQGVQSRASPQVIAGSLSAGPEPSRTMETPQFNVFYICSAPAATAASCPCHAVPQALKLSTLWRPQHNIRRISLCDGYGRCIFVRMHVRAMFPVDLGNSNEQTISREVQGCCAEGRVI